MSVPEEDELKRMEREQRVTAQVEHPRLLRVEGDHGARVLAHLLLA